MDGRTANHVHLAPEPVTDTDHDLGHQHEPALDDSYRMLTDALTRSDREHAAHTQLPTHRDQSDSTRRPLLRGTHANYRDGALVGQERLRRLPADRRDAPDLGR